MISRGDTANGLAGENRRHVPQAPSWARVDRRQLARATMVTHPSPRAAAVARPGCLASGGRRTVVLYYQSPMRCGASPSALSLTPPFFGADEVCGAAGESSADVLVHRFAGSKS
jgi:hypothetical protein